MGVSGPPPPHDPYENIRISPIEGDPSKEEQKKFSEKKEEKSNVVFAHFLKTLENLATFFLRKGKYKARKYSLKDSSIEEDIKQLIIAFERLKKDDYSQNVDYLNRISTWWHRLLEHSATRKKNTELFSAIENFIEKIHEYPEHEEHNLGYYLVEYAGAEWIPFPFMDMLQDLHQEHKKNPLSSHLDKWTRLLRDILTKISREY